MNASYDLHCHSTASDGTLSPAALVERAHGARVNVLSLTDHDTLDGIDEATAAAARLGLTLIPGVEISVTWSRMTIHVLGLNVQPDHAGLRASLLQQQAFRVWRAEEIARRLARKGIGGALEGARAFCKGSILSRTHFAHFLVQCGQAKSLQDVFSRFLVKGKPGYVAGAWTTLPEALAAIRQAGGLAVIAHPARYRLTRSKLQRLVGEFREAGGIGLEVVSGSHSRDETLHMAAVARTQGLLASCGSDYHGPEKPWVELGRLRTLPQGCTPIWQAPDWPAAVSA